MPPKTLATDAKRLISPCCAACWDAGNRTGSCEHGKASEDPCNCNQSLSLKEELATAASLVVGLLAATIPGSVDAAELPGMRDAARRWLRMYDKRVR